MSKVTTFPKNKANLRKLKKKKLSHLLTSRDRKDNSCPVR